MDLNEINQAMEAAQREHPEAFEHSSYEEPVPYKEGHFRYLAGVLLKDLSLDERVGPINEEQAKRFTDRVVGELGLAKNMGELAYLHSQLHDVSLPENYVIRALEEAKINYPKSDADFVQGLYIRMPFTDDTGIYMPLSHKEYPLLEKAPERMPLPADWVEPAARGIFYTVPALYELRQKLLKENLAKLHEHEARLQEILQRTVDLAPLAYSNNIVKVDKEGRIIAEPELRAAIKDIAGNADVEKKWDRADFSVICRVPERKTYLLGSLQLIRNIGNETEYSTLYNPYEQTTPLPAGVLNTALVIACDNSKFITAQDGRTPVELEKDLARQIQEHRAQVNESHSFSMGHALFQEYLQQEEAAGKITYNPWAKYLRISDTGMTYGREIIFDESQRGIDPETIRFMSEAWTHHLRPTVEGKEAFARKHLRWVMKQTEQSPLTALRVLQVGNISAEANAANYELPFPLHNPLAERLAQKRMELQDKQVDIVQAEIERFLMGKKIGKLSTEVSLRSDYGPSRELMNIFDNAELRGVSKRFGDINSIPWKSYTTVSNEGKLTHNFRELKFGEEAKSRNFGYLTQNTPGLGRVIRYLDGLDYTIKTDDEVRLRRLDPELIQRERVTEESWPGILKALEKVKIESIDQLPQLISLVNLASEQKPEVVSALLEKVPAAQRADVCMSAAEVTQMPAQVLDKVLPMIPEADRALYVASNRYWGTKQGEDAAEFSARVLTCQKHLPAQDWENVLTLQQERGIGTCFPLTGYLSSAQYSKAALVPEVINALTPRNPVAAQYIASVAFVDSIKDLNPDAYQGFESAINAARPDQQVPAFVDMADQVSPEFLAVIMRKKLDANRHRTEDYDRRRFKEDEAGVKRIVGMMSPQARGECLLSKEEGFLGGSFFTSLYGNGYGMNETQRAEMTACLATLRSVEREGIFAEKDYSYDNTLGVLTARVFDEYLRIWSPEAGKMEEARQPLVALAQLVASNATLKAQVVAQAEEKEKGGAYDTSKAKEKNLSATVKEVIASTPPLPEPASTAKPVDPLVKSMLGVLVQDEFEDELKSKPPINRMKPTRGGGGAVESISRDGALFELTSVLKTARGGNGGREK